ncbi:MULTISPECIES: DUF4275 family protein [Bacillus]|uniref:DUF4275 domain-containing protein n=1 Tax=Bacillus wiedmannii TaxID=1890302 RepID=A0A2C4Z3R0_9BACI|nr:DUF4275 family protein [Bacillus wiedmannii]MDF9665056.1 DUF4275 family protein [Bacillus wiedmannii]MDI6505278.1 DUF4275 family protein [Bacillus wiedmannii]MDI6511099.1 DUF4275 family protein [Bacillus wiedmannii]PFZ28198.1 hypothetical protein COL51_09300 [Bacillus wiedmannii]PGC19538.1 hypothetical protein COM08_09860 [Bacillus wiedmannii]
MEFKDVLRKKNMKVREFQNWGVYFRKRWEDHFANHLSDEEKEDIFLYGDKYACGYLWHIFSYEKKKCLEGEEAENAFHNIVKKDCYIFYQHCDDVLLIKDTNLLHTEDILCERDDMYKGDIYIVDKEFTWTFVKTHEHRWCGPYFTKKC